MSYLIRSTWIADGDNFLSYLNSNLINEIQTEFKNYRNEISLLKKASGNITEIEKLILKLDNFVLGQREFLVEYHLEEH